MSATQSMDAYEEVQIETAGHSGRVRERRRRGGQRHHQVRREHFHGEGSLYFTNSDLQALNIKGTPVSAPTTQTLYNYGFNFSLGGPIIKDKLWFFVSSGYAPSKYRYDGFSEDVPYSTINPMGKLTFQPIGNHRFSASFTYNRTRNPYMFAGLYTRPEATFNTTIQAYAVNAELAVDHLPEHDPRGPRLQPLPADGLSLPHAKRHLLRLRHGRPERERQRLPPGETALAGQCHADPVRRRPGGQPRDQGRVRVRKRRVP